MTLAQRAIGALREAYGPEGFNLGINQGKVAGAGVEHHVHLHVVPRWGADTNFMPVIGDTRVLPAEPGRLLRRGDRGMAGIDPAIFKAYDVRGLYGEQIDEDVAYRIGRAFARVLGDLEGKPTAELRVGLGRDMRLSRAGACPRATPTASATRARTWSTWARSAPRCSISRSARAASTAA